MIRVTLLLYEFIIDTILLWKMLTSVLRTLINNSVKESFYGKRKEKVINVLTIFFIFHKSGVKIYLK